MVKTYVNFLGKESLSCYRIESVKYMINRDCFQLKLSSYFDNHPEVIVNISYYQAIKAGFLRAHIASTNNALNSSGCNYAEDTSETVTDSVRKILRGNDYAENK